MTMNVDAVHLKKSILSVNWNTDNEYVKNSAQKKQYSGLCARQLIQKMGSSL